MSDLTVSVIIPNFNGEKLLEANLPLLVQAKNDPKNSIGEIIVVDDGSRDGSVKIILSKFPQVKLVKHKSNRGFSASVNTGVRTAKGDLVCILNSDVSVESNFLAHVFQHFQNPKVFAVSLNEQGEFGWAHGFFVDGFIGHSPGPKSDNEHDTFWVSGGSGVFKRNIWMELTGLDERLFLPFYWEDVDICYRALKRGYRLIWEPNAKVIHDHETTIKRFPKNYVKRVQERNQLRFIWKNLTSANLFRKHLVGLVERLAKHPGYIRIVIMAFGKIGLILKLRRREAREARISDETIFSRF